MISESGWLSVVGMQVKKDIPLRIHNDIITVRLHLRLVQLTITTFNGMSMIIITNRTKSSCDLCRQDERAQMEMYGEDAEVV